MSIIAQDIIDRIVSRLDAENTDHYNFARDFKPAINSAIEWAISVITPRLGDKKFSEETFRELNRIAVWQTSRFSRIMIDPNDFGGTDMWTINAILPTPTITVIDHTNISTLPPLYYDIVRFVEGGQYVNSPIVPQAWNATGNTLLKPNESTFRPELAFLESGYSAHRMTIEEYTPNVKQNPFSPGYNDSRPDILQYAYITFTNYTTLIGGYSLPVPREIEISPKIPSQLVAINWIEIPSFISAPTDTIKFPSTMINILTDKALNYISVKQNNNTNLYQVSNADLLTLLSVNG